MVALRQGISVELLCGPSVAGPHLDVSRVGHNRSPLDTFPGDVSRAAKRHFQTNACEPCSGGAMMNGNLPSCSDNDHFAELATVSEYLHFTT